MYFGLYFGYLASQSFAITDLDYDVSKNDCKRLLQSSCGDRAATCIKWWEWSSQGWLSGFWPTQKVGWWLYFLKSGRLKEDDLRYMGRIKGLILAVRRLQRSRWQPGEVGVLCQEGRTSWDGGVSATLKSCTEGSFWQCGDHWYKQLGWLVEMKATLK